MWYRLSKRVEIHFGAYYISQFKNKQYSKKLLFSDKTLIGSHAKVCVCLLLCVEAKRASGFKGKALSTKII